MTTTEGPGSTGHTEKIRARLKKAREDQNLSAPEVCRRIGSILRQRDPAAQDPHQNTIYAWEGMVRNPQIDHLAAWARALGLRLIVELADGSTDRRPVMLRSEEATSVARLVDQMTRDEQRAFLTLARSIRRDADTI